VLPGGEEIGGPTQGMGTPRKAWLRVICAPKLDAAAQGSGTAGPRGVNSKPWSSSSRRAGFTGLEVRFAQAPGVLGHRSRLKAELAAHGGGRLWFLGLLGVGSLPVSNLALPWILLNSLQFWPQPAGWRSPEGLQQPSPVPVPVPCVLGWVTLPHSLP
jgi:hypothetical protein